MKRDNNSEFEIKKAILAEAVKPKFEVITDYDGDLKGGSEARRYENGAIRNEKGQLLERAPGLVNFTPGPDGTGRQAQLKKWNDHSEAFARGLAEGLELPQNVGTAETWQAVGRHMGQAIKAGNVNRLPDIVRIASELGNFAPNRAQVQLLDQDIDVETTNREQELAVRLVELLERAEKRPKTIEGKVSDVDDDEG